MQSTSRSQRTRHVRIGCLFLSLFSLTHFSTISRNVIRLCTKHHTRMSPPSSFFRSRSLASIPCPSYTFVATTRTSTITDHIPSFVGLAHELCTSSSFGLPATTMTARFFGRGRRRHHTVQSSAFLTCECCSLIVSLRRQRTPDIRLFGVDFWETSQLAVLHVVIVSEFYSHEREVWA